MNSINILKRTIDKKIIIKNINNSYGAYISGDYTGIQSAIINLGINSSMQ